MRLKVGLLGIGKIARDQHIPALAASTRLALVACASRNATVEGVPSFPISRPCSRAYRISTAFQSVRHRRRISKRH